MTKPAGSVDNRGPIVLLREDRQWRLSISGTALSILAEHRQTKRWSTEAGGQLFGTIAPGLISVATATGPSPSDWRRRFGFRPSRRREQEDIDRLFSLGLHFLGNWHTHPDLQPSPSSLDLQSISDEFSKSEHQLPFFILLIVGMELDPRFWWVSSHCGDEILRFYTEESPP